MQLYDQAGKTMERRRPRDEAGVSKNAVSKRPTVRYQEQNFWNGRFKPALLRYRQQKRVLRWQQLRNGDLAGNRTPIVGMRTQCPNR